MKLVDSKQRPVESDPNWLCLGIAEDAGRTFVLVKDIKTDKSYIEEVVCKLNLDASKLSLDLKWIEDQVLWNALHKFFADNIIWKRVIDFNKMAADKLKL